MSETDRPALRVVRGNPDDAELAALTAVLSAAGTPEESAPEPKRSRWGDRARLLGRAPRPGPGAWGASALPR